jgi:hypothetical protein
MIVLVKIITAAEIKPGSVFAGDVIGRLMWPKPSWRFSD